MWEGMVVAVPVFAKGDKAEARQIIALDIEPCDAPTLVARPVGEVAYHPMADQGNGDAQADAPKDPGDAPKGEERQGEKRLLCHPVAFEPLVERVICDFRFDFEAGRMSEVIAAVKLPPGIAPEAGFVGRMGRAMGLPLVPVAHVMGADHAKGTGHSHQSAKPDQQALEPLRRFKSLVDEQPVHADGMPGANGDGGEDQEGENAAHAWGQYDGRDSPCDHGGQPERLCRVPVDLTVEIVGFGQWVDALCRQKLRVLMGHLEIPLR